MGRDRTGRDVSAWLVVLRLLVSVLTQAAAAAFAPYGFLLSQQKYREEAESGGEEEGEKQKKGEK